MPLAAATDAQEATEIAGAQASEVSENCEPAENSTSQMCL
jgi:hypothetical protein